MEGRGMNTKCILHFVIFFTWINHIKGQGCPSSASPVARMCSGDFVSGPRVFLDTSQVARATKNCTCVLRTTAETISISLLSAPNFQGCQSRLEFQSFNPFAFECMISGINTDVSQKKEFDVVFRKIVEQANNNYCADLKATPSAGGSITTVSLDCQSSVNPPTTSSTTTTTTTTTPTTTTASTTTSATTTNIRPTTDDPNNSTQTDSQTRPGEITTVSVSNLTNEPTTPTTKAEMADTGFPSSVSQTAIIIICVIVGAGLLVGIIIAIAAIMGKRSQPRRTDKNRFSAPRNHNFELAAENGTANGTSGHKENGRDENKQLNRSTGPRDINTPVSHTVYDNKGYLANETPYHGDTLVVSERL